nr:Transferrin receptor-like protein [Trypanosoma congolense IL3000]
MRKVFSTSYYCLGSGGDPAKRRDLIDCFPVGGKIEMGENNLAKIPERIADPNEPNLTAIITKVTHSAMASYFHQKYSGDDGANCNLINGKSGILGGGLKDKLWWGGGILTIGKSFDGKMEKTKFTAGEIADAFKDREGSKAFWTEKPSEKIPHLQKTLAAFQDFKDTVSRITQKFAKIEKIEKQIELCLSNETMEEGHTQSCFKNAVKLNAELQAANALLARYHKEKGPLPSGSASILHQSVVNVWFFFAFFL